MCVKGLLPLLGSEFETKFFGPIERGEKLDEGEQRPRRALVICQRVSSQTS